MKIQSYKELTVWQKAMDAAVETYKVVKKLPKEETYSISDQMRRAAVSVPSNIAEGQGRISTKEFLHFLAIAKGSICELETQFLLCVKIGYLAQTDIQTAMNLLDEVGKMISVLSKKLKVTIN